MADPVFRLGLHQSLPLFRPTVLSPGTYVYRLAPAGNSVLSTVFVKMIAVGATVDVKFYDFAAAANEAPSGRYDLDAHPQITTAPVTDRRIVNKIHADCLIEVIVAGGAAEVGMFVSVVTDFPVELVIPPSGIEVNVLDDGFEATQGVPRQFASVEGLQTTPAAEIDLVSATVPAGKIWRIRRALVSSRCWGKFRILKGATFIAQGTTGPATENARFDWDPYLTAVAGETVVLKFRESFGPAMDVSGFIQVTELDSP